MASLTFFRFFCDKYDNHRYMSILRDVIHFALFFSML